MARNTRRGSRPSPIPLSTGGFLYNVGGTRWAGSTHNTPGSAFSLDLGSTGGSGSNDKT